MFGQNNCQSFLGNSGLAACDVPIGKPIALLWSPSPVLIGAGDIDDLATFFETKATNPQKSQRIFPFTDIRQLDENSTDPTQATLSGYGYSIKVADGQLSYTFNFPTSKCRLKQLVQFDGQKGYMFILDDKYNLWGARTVDANKKEALRGFKLDDMSINANNAIFSDGVNAKAAKLVVNFGSDVKFIKSLESVSTEMDVDELQGVQNVSLVSTGVANTFQVVAGCSGENLYDYYKTQLINLNTWVIVDTSSNTLVTLDSITANDADKSFTLVKSSGFPVSYSVSLAAIDVLMLEGIRFFEQPVPYLVAA